MTKKFFPLVTAVIVAAVGFIATSTPAHAALSEDSRVVVVDLPWKADRLDTVVVYLDNVDGTVFAMHVPVVDGFATVLADNPADVAAITVKVGAKRLPADNYTVTDTTVPASSHGQEIGCPFIDDLGNRVFIDNTGKAVAV